MFMIIFDIRDFEDLILYIIIIINRVFKLLSLNCYFGVNKNGVIWWVYVVYKSKWCFKNVLFLKGSLLVNSVYWNFMYVFIWLL